jgi:hypothetical protein
MKFNSRSIVVFLLAAFVLISLPALAQDYKFTIPTAQTWTDTGVDLHNGDTLAVTASAGANGCDPSGVSGTGAAPGLPLSNAMPGALIRDCRGRSGRSSDPARSCALPAEHLGVNSAGTAPCQGSFAAKVHITPQGGARINQKRPSSGW